jgi:hypothetical protein
MQDNEHNSQTLTWSLLRIRDKISATSISENQLNEFEQWYGLWLLRKILNIGVISQILIETGEIIDLWLSTNSGKNVWWLIVESIKIPPKEP